MRQHAGEINPPGNRHRPASAMAAGPIRMIWKGGCIGNLERAKGFEPSTPTLARLGSRRSEEHTSELQSLMRISYAVFCLKKKKEHTHTLQSIISYAHDASILHN